MDRIRLKQDAKQDIQGRVWYAAQPYMVLLMLDWGLSIFSSISSRAQNDVIMYIFSVLSFIAGIVMFFIEFPIQIGIARYYMRMIDGSFAVWTEVFSDLKFPKIYWEELKSYLLIALLSVLGLFCFILPGIYVILLYSQVRFVFAEHPEYTRSQAMSRSVALMEGHIWELFCLGFSFIPWYFLSAITWGIAMVYVYPYTSCAYTRYYRSISAVCNFDNPDAPEGKTRRERKQRSNSTDSNPFDEFNSRNKNDGSGDNGSDGGIDYTSIE